MKTYTFHVNIPGAGRVWRKIELLEGQTLEDLHWAIQDAFDFDGDHLNSFFIGGDPWRGATEYSLPDDEIGSGLDFGESDEDASEEDQEDAGESPDSPGAAAMPMIDDVIKSISADADLRKQVAEMFSAQFGLSAAALDMLLQHAGPLLGALPPALGGMFGVETVPADVSVATLESLDLQQDQTFMYLFDYGDEWWFRVKVHRIDAESQSGVEYPRLVQVVGEAPPQYRAWGEYEEEEDYGEEEGDDEDSDLL